MSGGVTRPAATELVPCNLCGASDYDVVGRRDRDGHPLQTVLCRRCGLVWTNPRPAAGEIDRYYEDGYRADYSGASRPARRKILRGMLGAQDRIRTLHRVLRPGVTLLDVGCGAGELVFLLRRRQIDASGLEPGSEYADFARTTLGIPVQTSPVDAAVVPPASQDVVTMFHCLEHVADPKMVLATVRDWVKPGGHVVVEVPNIDSRVQAPSHRFHYAHLFHFTGPTLAAVGEAAGLRSVRTDYSPDGGNLIALFQRDAPSAARPAVVLEPHASRLRTRLLTHRQMRHYLSATPYLRTIARLRQRLAEDRLLGRLKTVDDVVRWAAERL